MLAYDALLQWCLLFIALSGNANKSSDWYQGTKSAANRRVEHCVLMFNKAARLFGAGKPAQAPATL